MHTLDQVRDELLSHPTHQRIDFSKLVVIAPEGEPAPQPYADGPVADFSHDAGGDGLKTFEDFEGDWLLGHFFAGEGLGKMLGVKVDLAGLTDDPASTKACEAAYRLIKRNEKIANLLLKKSDGIFGDLVALGFYGYTMGSVLKDAFKEARDLREAAEEADTVDAELGHGEERQAA